VKSWSFCDGNHADRIGSALSSAMGSSSFCREGNDTQHGCDGTWQNDPNMKRRLASFSCACWFPPPSPWSRSRNQHPRIRRTRKPRPSSPDGEAVPPGELPIPCQQQNPDIVEGCPGEGVHALQSLPPATMSGRNRVRKRCPPTSPSPAPAPTVAATTVSTSPSPAFNTSCSHPAGPAPITAAPSPSASPSRTDPSSADPDLRSGRTHLRSVANQFAFRHSIRCRRPWFILGAQTVDDAGSRSALCQNVRELCDSHLMPADRVIVKAHAYNEKKSWFEASRH
jgi:hypothetical protein